MEKPYLGSFTARTRGGIFFATMKGKDYLLHYTWIDNHEGESFMYNSSKLY